MRCEIRAVFGGRRCFSRDTSCWGRLVMPGGLVPCREKWCHMTQEERDDSLRFNENITFGQLG